MPRLNDTQTILLSTAAQRADLALLPLPDSLTPGARVTKALAALVKAGLAEERDAGSFATCAGLAAIGIEEEAAGAAADEEAPSTAANSTAPAPASAPATRVTKSAQVVELLGQPEGASLAELVAATGWLPHTTRAALTGLRKKGHAVERFRAGDVTRYRIAGAR